MVAASHYNRPVTAGVRFVFAPFELDPSRRRLTVSGEPVAVSDRHLDVLLLLVSRAGQIVSKDELLDAAWKDVAVGDNSLEQAVSGLRRTLGTHAGAVSFIETAPRRGYRFAVPVTQQAARQSDAGLDALLAPHRAFVEGRSALESLDRDQVARARGVFEDALRRVPDHASAHVGLANACAMQYEMTRTDSEPDRPSLLLAATHARDACRLDPEWGEAWATLGFVLDRTGDVLDARAAAKRAVALEPENWRHHFRLSLVSWGEQRLAAAHRTLALLPGVPLAHWLEATVYVARHRLPEAERALDTGVASQAPGLGGDPRFTPVALHWLLGLIHLSRGEDARALEAFALELSLEASGHLYARESCANTWYAVGALKLRQGRVQEAGAAFQEALQRVPSHPMARVGAAATGVATAGLDALTAGAASSPAGQRTDAAIARAVYLTLSGAHTEAAALVGDALSHADRENAAWLLPVEPLLHVSAHPDVWARTLVLLRNRAA